MMKRMRTPMMRRMKRMSGNTQGIPFNHLYYAQKVFQERLVKENLPQDNVGLFTYHVSAMVEEMGEVMKADKRWKTHRNTAYNPEEKLDELADVFITAMNLAIYSGFSSHDIENAILNKIKINNERLDDHDSNC